MHTIKSTTDENQAKEWWNQFYSSDKIDNLWDFRYAFFAPVSSKLLFIAGFEDGSIKELLALQYNDGSKMISEGYPTTPFWEIFGGDDMDDNIITHDSDQSVSTIELLDNAPRPLFLAPLAHALNYKMHKSFLIANRYELRLDQFINSLDYVEKCWRGNAKGNLKRQMRRLHRDHAITIYKDRREDLSLLFNLNQARFDTKSSFRYPYRQKLFRQLFQLFTPLIVSIEVDDVVQAVSMGILYKSTYISLNSGANDKISNLGKMLILQQIEEAIQKGMTFYDAGKGSGGWKEEFGFSSIPQYALSVSQ